jgi:hypothetical protein
MLARHLASTLALMALGLGCAPPPEAPLPPDALQEVPESSGDIPTPRPDILFMDEQEEGVEDEDDAMP